MTTSNRLAKAAEPAFDRSTWALQEHCDYANAQMHLKGLHEYRRKVGLPQAHWVICNGRVTMELKK